MSKDVIEKLLDFTNAIYFVQFTGGEPFLAIDKIELFLDECKKRNVVILGVSFPSNGTILNDRVVNLIKAWSDYIAKWLTEEERESLKNRIAIGVSTDIFHGTDFAVKKRFRAYKDALGHYATVFEAKSGNIPLAIGRAQNIEYAVPDLEEIHKVSYKIGHKCNLDTCTESYLARTFGKEQVIICCGLTLDANGGFPARLQYDFNDPGDNPLICHVDEIHNSTDFLKAIDRFNESYPDCKHIPTDETKQRKYKEIVKSHPYKIPAILRSLPQEAGTWLSVNYQFAEEQAAALNKIRLTYSNRYTDQIRYNKNVKAEIERSRIFEETPALINTAPEELLTQMNNNPAIKRLKSAMIVAAKQSRDKPKDRHKKKKASDAKFAYLAACNEFLKTSKLSQSLKKFSADYRKLKFNI